MSITNVVNNKYLDVGIVVIMSYTVMSDAILKELDSKTYQAITKTRSDRKRAEINGIHKEVIKTPIPLLRTLLKTVYKIELINY